MNWDRIAGNWKQLKGSVKERWGKLTDDDLAIANGKREILAGLLQEKYGLTKAAVDKELEKFTTACDGIACGGNPSTDHM